MAVITSLTRSVKSSVVYTWEVSLTSRTPYKCIPLCQGFETIPNCLTSCLHLSLITGSDFFRLRPLLAFGMPPLIFRHMLLDHQSVCKEHGHTIIIKCLNDKDSVLRSGIYYKKQKYFLVIFFSFANCWHRNNLWGHRA
jgi:hypothetical protein